MVVKTSADKQELCLFISADSANDGADVSYKKAERHAIINMDGKLPDNQMKYAASFAVFSEDGSVLATESGISVLAASDVTIIFSAATDYKNELQTT